MDELNLNSERLDQLVLHGSSYASARPLLPLRTNFIMVIVYHDRPVYWRSWTLDSVIMDSITQCSGFSWSVSVTDFHKIYLPTFMRQYNRGWGYQCVFYIHFPMLILHKKYMGIWSYNKFILFAEDIIPLFRVLVVQMYEIWCLKDTVSSSKHLNTLSFASFAACLLSRQQFQCWYFLGHLFSLAI